MTALMDRALVTVHDGEVVEVAYRGVSRDRAVAIVREHHREPGLRGTYEGPAGAHVEWHPEGCRKGESDGT